MKKLVWGAALVSTAVAWGAAVCETCGVDGGDIWAKNRTIGATVWHPYYEVAAGRFDFKVFKAKNGYSKINGKFTSATGVKGRLANQQVLTQDSEQRFAWSVPGVGEVKFEWWPVYSYCSWYWCESYNDLWQINITGAPEDTGYTVVHKDEKAPAMWEWGDGYGPGEALSDGEYCFEVDTYNFPKTIKGLPVMTAYLPVCDYVYDKSKEEYRFEWASSVRVACNGGTLSKPKADKIKLNKQTGKPEVVGGGTNMSAVKLTYKDGKGTVKGSMKIYLWDNAKQKISFVTGKIMGFCTYEGAASGLVTIKDVGSYPFWLWKKQ